MTAAQREAPAVRPAGRPLFGSRGSGRPAGGPFRASRPNTRSSAAPATPRTAARPLGLQYAFSRLPVNDHKEFSVHCNIECICLLIAHQLLIGGYCVILVIPPPNPKSPHLFQLIIVLKLEEPNLDPLVASAVTNS